jgi:hypothetical protein
MSANQISAKPGARLGRIKTVSLILRVLIGMCLVLGVPDDLAIYFGWLPVPAHRKILISPHQLFASASEIPNDVLALALVRLGLNVFAVWCYSIYFGSTDEEFYSRRRMSNTYAFWDTT